MIHIEMPDTGYCNSHETICTGILEKNEWNTYFFMIRLIEILWYSSTKSNFASASSSCSTRYSIHWRSRLCAVLLITGVSAFINLWHPSGILSTLFRYLSRYVTYHDLFIEMQIVSWDTHIVTPLLLLQWKIDTKMISYSTNVFRCFSKSRHHEVLHNW